MKASDGLKSDKHRSSSDFIVFIVVDLVYKGSNDVQLKL